MNHLNLVGNNLFACNDSLFVLGISFEPVPIAAHFMLGKLDVRVDLNDFHAVQFSEILTDVEFRHVHRYPESHPVGFQVTSRLVKDEILPRKENVPWKLGRTQRELRKTEHQN